MRVHCSQDKLILTQFPSPDNSLGVPTPCHTSMQPTNLVFPHRLNCQCQAAPPHFGQSPTNLLGVLKPAISLGPPRRRGFLAVGMGSPLSSEPKAHLELSTPSCPINQLTSCVFLQPADSLRQISYPLLPFAQAPKKNPIQKHFYSIPI